MDNYIVSARKYRPSTFQSVVGQKSLTVTLKNAILSNKLAHAYLFCGPRGVGKTSCARIFAKTINCMNRTPEGEACNGCESCISFNEQRSYSIHELDAASNNTVDGMRSLIEQVRIPPSQGKYKVFIIDEVHMLSTQAFNAFLKTLEEPPHYALFILATTERHKVLPTILSRCQIYDFARISVQDIADHLTYVAKCEGIAVEPEALNVIAQKADGGMRDALSVFDQVAGFTNGNVTYQAVIENLNVLDYDYYFRFTEAILAGNVYTSIVLLNQVLGMGFDGQNVVTGLSSHFRDLLVCKDESTLVLLEVGASIRERYREMAKRCTEQLLFRAIELANTCDLNYRASRNKRLLVELALIQLCQLCRPDAVTDDAKKKGLIEPIPSASPVAAPVPTPQPQPQRMASAPVTVPATSPTAPVSGATAPPVTVPVQPVQSPAASARPKTTTRPPVGFSLKEMGGDKPSATKGPQEVVHQAQQSSPFTQEELEVHWNSFAGSIVEKVYLKNTMINCKPVLLPNFGIEVAVHNPGQRDELTNGATDLLPFLRSTLKNSGIEMRVRIIDANEKRLAYTTSERYEHLLQLNPILTRLQTEFDLRAD